MPYVQSTLPVSYRWVDLPYELKAFEKFIDTQPKTDNPTAPDLKAIYESLNTRLTDAETRITALEGEA